MDFEESLERLKERHEALAQSVEMLHRDIVELKAVSQTLVNGTTRNFEIVLDSIKRLENIATAHEHRISRLERDEE